MPEPRGPARDSSLQDRKAPEMCLLRTRQPRTRNLVHGGARRYSGFAARRVRARSLSQSAGALEELPHHAFHCVVLAFAGMLEDDLSALIENVLRRPVLVPVGVPGRVFIVLCDRIVDAVPLEGGLHIAGGFLERELRRMDADNDEAF